MIDVVYKHHAVVYVYVFLMLCINLRLVGLNIYFYDAFFSYKNGSKKGYIEMRYYFYYEINMKCAQFVNYSTTKDNSFLSFKGSVNYAYFRRVRRF